MLDKAIYEHLVGAAELAPLLTSYAGKAAVFNQEAPADTDPNWADGAQYGRIIFALDVQGDPARAMGGSLMVDVMCEAGIQAPEELEPVVRKLIDGYFFTDDGCTMAAQWESSRYFMEAEEQVSGVTISFSLLAFPAFSTVTTDIIARINEWTSKRFPELIVINRDTLPAAWKPENENCAVYWRIVTIMPAEQVKDTYQTIYRTALLKCHIFAPDICKAAVIAQEIALRLYCNKRIISAGEGSIYVSRNNIINTGADALREGQLTVEATYGEIVRMQPNNPLHHINYV